MKPLLGLFAFALAVRILLFSGTHCGDDLIYRQHAHDTVKGTFVPHDHWSGRMAFVALLAAAEHTLGTSDVAAAVVPTLFWLAGLAAVYTIAGGGAAGFTAGVVAASVPNSLLWGGTAMTDVPSAALMALSAALFVRACGTGRGAALSGMVLGAAWLMRESAILLLPFLAIARRPRPAACALAGFAAVLIGEAACLGAATGDPLARFHFAQQDPTVSEGEKIHQPDLAWRLTGQIPSMMLNPADRDAAYFGFFFVAAAVAAFAVRRQQAALLPLLWGGAVLAAVLWLPQSLSPFQLAIHAHPQKLEPLVAPAAVLIGLAATTNRRRALVALLIVSNLALAWVLKFDNDYRIDGARAAHRRLAGEPGPISTDERTALLFMIWDGFPDPPRARPVPAPVVISREPVPAGTVVEWEHVTPGRRRLRSAERLWNDYTTRIYRVP